MQYATPSLQHWGLYLRFVRLLIFFKVILVLGIVVSLSCPFLGLVLFKLSFVSCLLSRLYVCLCLLVSSAFDELVEACFFLKSRPYWITQGRRFNLGSKKAS